MKVEGIRQKQNSNKNALSGLKFFLVNGWKTWYWDSPLVWILLVLLSTVTREVLLASEQLIWVKSRLCGDKQGISYLKGNEIGILLWESLTWPYTDKFWQYIYRWKQRREYQSIIAQEGSDFQRQLNS